MLRGGRNSLLFLAIWNFLPFQESFLRNSLFVLRGVSQHNTSVFFIDIPICRLQKDISSRVTNLYSTLLFELDIFWQRHKSAIEIFLVYFSLFDHTLLEKLTFSCKVHPTVLYSVLGKISVKNDLLSRSLNTPYF